MNKRLVLTCGLVAGIVVGTGATAALQGPAPWSQVGWKEWTGWSPESRQAWTDGFLAGAALGQAPDSVAADSLRLAQWMTGHPAGRRFPFGSNLYQARLQDWYFWENHRAAPLWQGVTTVNDELQPPTR